MQYDHKEKKYDIKHIILCLSLLFVSFVGSSQTDDWGNWIMYFGQNKLSDRYSLHTEVQYRNHTLLPNEIQQLLLRTGLNYHLSADGAMATAGYAYIASHMEDSEQLHPEMEEHRIWQQFILINNIPGVKFEHRYRVEQRWINRKYKNRFRYRIMAFVPINKKKLEARTVFLGLYDEIFINGSQDFFALNRLYGAAGYQWANGKSLQIGALHQQTPDVGKWYLQFALIYNLDWRKQEDE